MVLARKRLLARLAACDPRLVRLIAPPGYGKTSLARSLARRFERNAVLNCARVTSFPEFCGRVLSALADESAGGADAIASTRLALQASDADPATWSRAVLEEWKARRERSFLSIESADALLTQPDALALVDLLLAARPGERAIAIVSRAPVPLRIAHAFAPHHVLTFSPLELRIDDEEALRIFEGTDVASNVLERILRAAGGWPIALLLLARFAHYDAHIERLLDRLESVAFSGRYEFLVGEVLAALTPDMMSTLLAAAAIPNASLDDLVIATGIGHVMPILDSLLRLPGFMSSEGGVYCMHPLLFDAVREQHANEVNAYLLRAASENERTGNALRAAELYLARNDAPAAARALERVAPATLEQPAARLADAFARLPASMIDAHPNLWLAALRYRRNNVAAESLYGQARTLQALLGDAPPALQRRLSVRRAILARETGRLDEARATLEAADAAEDVLDERRLILMTAAVVAAERGRFDDADRYVERADCIAAIRYERFESERALVATAKARFYGEWHDVLRSSEDVLAAAQRAGVTARISEAAREVAWAAWYCNEDDRATGALQLMADCGEPGAFAALPVAQWHAALVTADVGRASDLFDAAISGIDEGENDLSRIAVRVCAALLLSTQRRRLLEARVIAQRIESPPLQASIELLVDSHEPTLYGIFTLLAARVSRSPMKRRRSELSVHIVSGQVRRGTEVLHVSDRGFELLAALALLPAGTSKEALAAAIWPALDARAALNSLKMCVSRTRVQVADREAIVSTRNGYALDAHVNVDTREVERLVRGIRGTSTIGESMRRQARETIEALETQLRAHARDWAWFEPYAAHFGRLHRELTALLGEDPGRNGAPAATLS